MTSAVIQRRRLLAGGGAVLGLAALTRCALGPDHAEAGAEGARTAGRAGLMPPPASAVTPATNGRLTSPALSVDIARLVEAPLLADRIEDVMERRGGVLALEVVDLRRGEAFRVEESSSYCYSTIKVLVLMTLLRQAQETGRPLTERQHSLATRMITRSDNSAAEAILGEVGREEVQRVAGIIGMTHTEIDAGWWGLWRTRAHDLDRMVDALLSSDRVLDATGRATVRLLMADVVPAQRWGVFTAEQRDGVSVAGKNGWGPSPDGYHVNTTGWVTGPDVAYVLSILSRSVSGFAHGRETLGRVSELCHDAVRAGLS